VLVPSDATKGEVFQVRTIISHQMETGLRHDKQGRNVDEVDDGAFDRPVGANPDERLIARLAADIHVLGGDDLLRGHVAFVDDYALDRPAAGNGGDVVCMQG